jgi:O-acetyl-ADP-ribose deacetylase (regulator of RNase III)
MVLYMIRLNSGDILTASTEAIVNTVNCAGVMGKGIALQFKMKYPDNYKFYKKVCDQGRMLIGQVLIFQHSQANNPKYIINFPTKRHWKGKSNIDDIKKGLNSLVSEIRQLNIKSIAIPALGSGLGGLDWREVKSIVIDAFSILPNVEVQLYEPHFAPIVKEMSVNTKKPKMTLTRALLIKLLQVYQTLGYPHSLLEIQKLMYFMDILLGNELNLQFVKKQYGPYTNKINHVLQDMENHYIRGYGDRVQKAEIRLLEGAISEAEMFLSDKENYLEKINKIERLIDGFETPFGMELLSTVHWVSTRECEESLHFEQVISKIQQWSTRKKQLFNPYQIESAFNRLQEEKWI